MGVYNELLVLGCAKLWVAANQEELIVQVVEAGTPCATAQGRADCEMVANRCELGCQHHGVRLTLLTHDGAQERPDIPQQLRSSDIWVSSV